MSALSWLGSKLGGVFGADDSQARAAGGNVQDIINSGTVQNGADMGLTTRGTPGASVWDAGIALGKSPGASVDTTAIDANQQKLDAVTQHYLELYKQGGMEGKAAVDAAQQAAAFHAQGGIGGIHQNIMASGDRQAQVGSIAQNEISQAGDQVNSLDQQSAATALQKAIFAAHVQNANYLKNQGVKNTLFGLTNAQGGFNNQATSILNDARNGATSTGIDLQKAQGNVGQQALDMLTSALSTGVGTGVSAFQNATANTAQLASTTTPIAAPSLIEGSGTSAGYLAPSASLGRALVPQGQQSAIFATGPSLPVNANQWNGRTG